MLGRAAKTGVAALSVAAVLSGSAVAQAAPPPGEQPPRGAARTGVYPSQFERAGYPRRAVDDKVEATWRQLFHGSPGTRPDRSDGRSIYYRYGDDMAYVEDIGNQDVRTEGMGYAMMIAVQLGHKEEFDALWKFAQAKMQFHSGPQKYYFAWHTDTNGKIIDNGVAPDGDQWIAAALAFASGRWGDGSGVTDYGQQSRQILHAMWHRSEHGGVDMFDHRTHLPTFSPPNTVDRTDPSYALPAFYRVFAAVDPADAGRWMKAADAGEQLLRRAPAPATGLSPDYSHFDGSPYLAPGETPGDDSYTHNFQEDAWRVIANANVDAQWFGAQPWQRRFSDTLQNFFAGQGVGTYASRYHLDGTPVENGQNGYEPQHAQGLVAMNSTSTISATGGKNQAFLRDFWNAPIPQGKARYYDGMLHMLGLLYDSGKFRIWPH